MLECFAEKEESVFVLWRGFMALVVGVVPRQAGIGTPSAHGPRPQRCKACAPPASKDGLFSSAAFQTIDFRLLPGASVLLLVPPCASQPRLAPAL